MKCCHLLHHRNPYLKLGPFKEEVISYKPYVVIFRDFLSDSDIDNLIKVSLPNLSKARTFENVGGAQTIHDVNSGKYPRIIHKSVQAWIEDVKWPDFQSAKDYVGTSHLGIINIGLWKLNKRIALATQMNTNTQTSGTLMQV